MGTEWKPTPEEARMHDLFDQLADFAEELGMNRDIVDGLFNVFYGTLEDQGKMSDIEVTEEEINRVRAAVAAKLNIDLSGLTQQTEEPPAPSIE